MDSVLLHQSCVQGRPYSVTACVMMSCVKIRRHRLLRQKESSNSGHTREVDSPASQKTLREPTSLRSADLLSLSCQFRILNPQDPQILKILESDPKMVGWSQNGAVFAANPFGICVLPVKNMSENEGTDDERTNERTHTHEKFEALTQ